jgi:DNA-binding response OmpR family regulator
MIRQDRDLILVVEDDPDVSEMLCTYLRTKRYRLATTPMGSDVLSLCQAENPSLVLLDINLPDIDGYEVCRRLRANLATSTLPILFLTQKRLREERLTGFEVGADDYITKPFDMEELHLRMRNALGQAKHRAGIGHVSRLPEGPLVAEQLKKLLYAADWAVLSIRVAHFDRFTKAHGHLKDKFVQYIGQLLLQATDEAGNFGDFVARVGTIDFIIITTPPRIARLRERIRVKFDQVMNPRTSRPGAKPVTATLGLVFGTITDQDGPYGDIRSLSVAIARSHGKDSQ